MQRAFHCLLMLAGLSRAVFCSAAPEPARAGLLDAAVWREKIQAHAADMLTSAKFKPTNDQQLWLVNNITGKDEATGEEKILHGWPPENMSEKEKEAYKERLHKAAIMIKEYAGQTPGAEQLYFLAGEYFSRSEDYENTIFCFEEALEHYPRNEKAEVIHGMLQHLYMQLEEPDYKKAIRHARLAIGKGASSARTYGVLGYLFAKAGKPAQAEEAFRIAVLRDPANKDWKLSLIQTLTDAKKYAEANTLIEEYLREDPENVDLWNLQANNYLGLDEIGETVIIYEMLQRMGKAGANSLMQLGRIYIIREMLDLAAETYMRAAEADPPPALSQITGAVKLLTNYAAYPQAERLIAKIRQSYQDVLTEEKDLELLTIQSKIFMATDKGDQAKSTLEKIIALDPANCEAMVALGQHLFRQDDLWRAGKYFKMAEKMEHGEDKECLFNAYVGHAQLAVREHEYQEAIELLEKALVIEDQKTIRNYKERIEYKLKEMQAVFY